MIGTEGPGKAMLLKPTCALLCCVVARDEMK